jgi:hypothetical protein
MLAGGVRRVSRAGPQVGLVLAVLVSQAFALAHFGLVRHEYCPDHGELTHPSELPRAGRRVDQDRTHAGVRPVQIEHREGHDHCAVSGTRRSATLSQESSVVVDAPARTTDELPGLPPPGRVLRFIIAPKQSPPV